MSVDFQHEYVRVGLVGGGGTNAGVEEIEAAELLKKGCEI